MKTLEQIKNDYSSKIGYISWEVMISRFANTGQLHLITLHENEVMKIYARECLKLASENSFCNMGNNEFGFFYKIDKESITNENNIIK